MTAFFPAGASERSGTAAGRSVADAFAYGRPARERDRFDGDGILPQASATERQRPVQSRWIASVKLIGLVTTLVAATGIAVSILVRIALSGFATTPGH
jgi:hypothetical protein